jgi:hypothetical protein
VNLSVLSILIINNISIYFLKHLKCMNYNKKVSVFVQEGLPSIEMHRFPVLIFTYCGCISIAAKVTKQQVKTLQGVKNFFYCMYFVKHT